jgi:hypothetical protein
VTEFETKVLLHLEYQSQALTFLATSRLTSDVHAALARICRHHNELVNKLAAVPSELRKDGT